MNRRRRASITHGSRRPGRVHSPNSSSSSSSSSIFNYKILQLVLQRKLLKPSTLFKYTRKCLLETCEAEDASRISQVHKHVLAAPVDVQLRAVKHADVSSPGAHLPPALYRRKTTGVRLIHSFPSSDTAEGTPARRRGRRSSRASRRSNGRESRERNGGSEGGTRRWSKSRPDGVSDGRHRPLNRPLGLILVPTIRIISLATAAVAKAKCRSIQTTSSTLSIMKE